ncbi:alpha/beta-hydrolase [Artomyces pyxidatus]|uniref:Alpha/beta-hydrolase n=1 Tax=Artomyces pyxidatus TaxID=48021 RepID=A0ACB8T7B2_9AGAM|nr:alpha/beta-hydrolase [Artomyces pyxidatus]
MYDKTPVYPHQEHLYWAHEPWKSIYVWQRLFTTLLLVPIWALYHLLTPRSTRPRPSWSITQIIVVKFTKRIYKVTEVAGVTWGTRDPTKAPDERTLKETRFAWVPPLPEELRTGIVDDKEVACMKVDAQFFTGDADANVDIESDAADAPPRMIGIFLHGGGYCHMSAHENSGTSRIPRRLIKDKLFQEIHAVEYRLLQHAPIPAAIQDAAAVYAHLHPVDRHRPRIILIGDSAGGNLVLALARWIRDEGVLPVPDGMMLLSPSCDPSHTLPQVPASRRPRPHSDTDYLLDTPEPRALMQRTFLGTHPIEMVYSPYVSPASEWVLSVFHGKDTLDDLVPLAGAGDDRAYTETTAPVRTTASNPYIRVPPGMGLFTEFPRALVVVGDAERLEREVVALEKGMERDGVRVRMVWAKDAVHDILIMGAWDERVREGVWREIRKWVKEIAEQ